MHTIVKSVLLYYNWWYTAAVAMTTSCLPLRATSLSSHHHGNIPSLMVTSHHHGNICTITMVTVFSYCYWAWVSPTLTGLHCRSVFVMYVLVCLRPYTVNAHLNISRKFSVLVHLVATYIRAKAWYWLKRILRGGWLCITSRACFIWEMWFVDCSCSHNIAACSGSPLHFLVIQWVLPCFGLQL